MIEELYDKLLWEVKSVDDRVFPLVMPQGCDKPALVYTIVSDVDHQTSTGCVEFSSMRVQVDVYATTYFEAREIRDEVREAMYNFSLYPENFNSVDSYENDTGLFRQKIDFTLRRK